uniref:Uncharacterized protein n=1 Tax=Burkholderia sp. M701 TaxID=326454 RepID=V5YPG7_9BURK|nr:hypothetical protein [Burkholderia sp. M701]
MKSKRMPIGPSWVGTPGAGRKQPFFASAEDGIGEPGAAGRFDILWSGSGFSTTGATETVVTAAMLVCSLIFFTRICRCHVFAAGNWLHPYKFSQQIYVTSTHTLAE